jgi:hypothetical protein
VSDAMLELYNLTEYDFAFLNKGREHSRGDDVDGWIYEGYFKIYLFIYLFIVLSFPPLF